MLGSEKEGQHASKPHPAGSLPFLAEELWTRRGQSAVFFSRACPVHMTYTRRSPRTRQEPSSALWAAVTGGETAGPGSSTPDHSATGELLIAVFKTTSQGPWSGRPQRHRDWSTDRYRAH